MISKFLSKNKIIIIAIIIVIIAGIGYWFYQSQLETNKTPKEKFVFDQKNCTYNIDGKDITLKDGLAEEVIPDSSSKIVTRYFGNEAFGDFNNDGLSDVAFLFSQNSGGSGTFYYIAVALNGTDKCLGTNAIFFGDRIAPQTTEFRNGEIILNYADRKINEPMVAHPSIGVSKYFKVSENKLIEIKK